MVDEEDFYEEDQGYEDEEGYEEEAEGGLDIPQIHTTHKAILATLNSQRAMMETELENAKINLEGAMSVGIVKTMGWSLQVQYFIKANETLRLTNFQIIKTYEKYLSTLQGAMATIEKSGEDVDGLHKLISVLEIQNAKLEDLNKQAARSREVQHTQTVPENTPAKPIKTIVKQDSTKEELPPYIQPVKREKEEEKAEEKEQQEQPTKKKYGRHHCNDCGVSLRGKPPNQLYCTTCMKERQRKSKEDSKRRAKLKKRNQALNEVI